jgi:hypothetical protein
LEKEIGGAMDKDFREWVDEYTVIEDMHYASLRYHHGLSVSFPYFAHEDEFIEEHGEWLRAMYEQRGGLPAYYVNGMFADGAHLVKFQGGAI